MMSDKAPYVVSLIFGVLGWLVGHMVDRIVDAPTLEYRLEKADTGARRGLSVKLVNVTREKSFDKLQARIVIPDAKNYERATLESVEPAFEGTTAPQTSGDTTNFALPLMMPGTAITFGVFAASGGEPRLSIWSDGSQPIRLEEPSLETFFAKHEMGVFAGLFLVWLGALVAWAAWATGRKADSATTASAPAATATCAPAAAAAAGGGTTEGGGNEA